MQPHYNLLYREEEPRCYLYARPKVLASCRLEEAVESLSVNLSDSEIEAFYRTRSGYVKKRMSSSAVRSESSSGKK